jgi:hypothetical protein
MLSWQLMWEGIPLEGISVREQCALAGRRGPQELLIGKPVLGSTPLARAGVADEQILPQEMPAEHLDLKIKT